MVWAAQESIEDAMPGVDSVKAKPLKKRCSSRAGLSRYYSSKSQSFSSLDMVQCTPFGTSALALAKRPSSFDLRRGSPRSGHGRRAFATLPNSDEVCMGMANEQEQEGDGISAGRCCPCNDTIFTDPADAFISPEGSPSASPLQLYDSYGRSSTAAAPFQLQQQQLQLTSEYLHHLTALLPFQQGFCCSGSGSAGGGGLHGAASASGCSCGSCCSSSSSGNGLCRGTTTSSLSTCDSGSLIAGAAGRTSSSWKFGPQQLATCTSSCTKTNVAGSASGPNHSLSGQHSVAFCCAPTQELPLKSSAVPRSLGWNSGGVGRSSSLDASTAGIGRQLAAPTNSSCYRASRSCVSAGGYPAGAMGADGSDCNAAAVQRNHQTPATASATVAAAVGRAELLQHQQQVPPQWPLGTAAAGANGVSAPVQCHRSGLMRHRVRHSIFGRSSTSNIPWSSTEDLIASLSLSDGHHHHHISSLDAQRRRGGVPGSAALPRPPLSSLRPLHCCAAGAAGGNCGCSCGEVALFSPGDVYGLTHQHHQHKHQRQEQQQQGAAAQLCQPQPAASQQEHLASIILSCPAALPAAAGFGGVWCGSEGAAAAAAMSASSCYCVQSQSHQNAAVGLCLQQPALRHKSAGSDGAGCGAPAAVLLQPASCPVVEATTAVSATAAAGRAFSVSGARGWGCGGSGDVGRCQERPHESQLQQPQPAWVYGSAPSRISTGLLGNTGVFGGTWKC